MAKIWSWLRSDSDKFGIDYGGRSALQYPESFGIVRNGPESSGIAWSYSESESSEVVWSRPESSGVVRSRLESSGVIQNRLQTESSGVGWGRGLYRKCTRKVNDKKHNERKYLITSTLNHTAPVDSNQLRFRTTPNDSRQLRSSPDDSEQLRTTPKDSGRLQTTPTPGGSSGSILSESESD